MLNQLLPCLWMLVQYVRGIHGGEGQLEHPFMNNKHASSYCLFYYKTMSGATLLRRGACFASAVCTGLGTLPLHSFLSSSLLSPTKNRLAYIENTLQFHSSFKEAAVGLRTVKCVLVLKKHDMFDVAAVAEGGVRWWAVRMCWEPSEMHCMWRGMTLVYSHI